MVRSMVLITVLLGGCASSGYVRNDVLERCFMFVRDQNGNSWCVCAKGGKRVYVAPSKTAATVGVGNPYYKACQNRRLGR